MAVHHDNFDLWNSTHQPRWNSVAMGPKKDIVGVFRKAARKEGLRFGVSEHLAVSYHWFSTSHGARQDGRMAGVPYDGADPEVRRPLSRDPTNAPHERDWNRRPAVPDCSGSSTASSASRTWSTTTSPTCSTPTGRSSSTNMASACVAHLYNAAPRGTAAKCEAVYTSKRARRLRKRAPASSTASAASSTGSGRRPVADRHLHRQLALQPGSKYKSPKIVIDMLVDIVSRNGNLLLNFPLPNSGMLDPKELVILDEITKWMAVNSEAIYSTRPWKAYGDGPAITAATRRAAPPANITKPARFNEAGRKPLSAADIRFTQKGGTLYAFAMGRPEAQVKIPILAPGGEHSIGKIRSVEMLGAKGKLKWTPESGRFNRGNRLRAAGRTCWHSRSPAPDGSHEHKETR